MKNQFAKLRVSWLFVGFASLIVSVFGVLRPEIYDEVVSTGIVPGVFSQDILAIAGAAVLLVLAFSVKRTELMKQVVILGLLGFFFYAYGLYVMEQVYTVVHLVYMAIFGVSSFSIAFTIAGIPWENLKDVSMPRSIRVSSLAILVITPLIFIPLWIGRLVPLIQSADRIEYTFSVMIIDLCFIMPGFVIVAYKMFRQEITGTALAPALFILGFFILSPLAIAELIKPIAYDQAIEAGPLGLYAMMSVIYLGLTLFSLNGMKVRLK
jgi:hypothetical protein